MDKLIDKVKRILFSPKTAWDEIKTEESTQISIIKDYLLYLVAIPIVANFIGQAIIGYPLRGDRVNFFRGLIWAVFAYVLYQVSLYVSAMVVNALAPQFESTKNSVAAFKLVAYSSTAALVAGVVAILPSIAPLAILGLIYTIYLFYLGLPVLMETPKEKVVPYTVVSILAIIIISAVIMGIAGAILA